VLLTNLERMSLIEYVTGPSGASDPLEMTPLGLAFVKACN